MWRPLYVKIEQAKEKLLTMHNICDIYGNQKNDIFIKSKAFTN